MLGTRNLGGKVLGTALVAVMIAETWVQAAVDAFITIQHEGFTPGTAERGETIQCGCLATTVFDMGGFTLVLTHDTGMLSFESVSFANGVWSNADYTSASVSNGRPTIAAVADSTNSGKFVPAGMNLRMFDVFFRVGECTGSTTIGLGSGGDDNILVDTHAVGHFLTAADLVSGSISIKAVDAFIRGNARNDPIDVSLPFSASVNILDGVFLLDYLYASGPAPACLDAADANNDGRINIVDPIVVFQEVFGNSAVSIPEPFDSFGMDTGTGLGCATPPESVGCGVVPNSPVAQINHPGDGETRSAANPVSFVGVGRDLEDGALSGGALVWTSNRDGVIGTGETFSAMLSEGTHSITLTVTDSAGNSDSESITLIMTP